MECIAEAELDLLREHGVRRQLQRRGSGDGCCLERLAAGSAGEIRSPRRPRRDVHCIQRQRGVQRESHERPAVPRSVLLPELRAGLTQCAHRLDFIRGHRTVHAAGHSSPRARAYHRVPTRAHSTRGGNLLRGQQLAGAHDLRLGVGDALSPVQRHQQGRSGAHPAGHLRGGAALRSRHDGRGTMGRVLGTESPRYLWFGHRQPDVSQGLDGDCLGSLCRWLGAAGWRLQ